MRKKYCKTSFLTLLEPCVVPFLFSCTDDKEEGTVSLNPPQYESVSGKYEITNSSFPYESIEFRASGSYIVINRSSGYSVSSLEKDSLFSWNGSEGSRKPSS